MDSKEFKLELIEEITHTIFPSSYSNNELGVRCPFCGDSVKDPNHHHLNIRINPDDNEPIVFRCLRCNISGLLTSDTLAMIGNVSTEYASALKKYNRLSSKKSGIIINKQKLDLKFPELKITDGVIKKHKYIEHRLGLKLDIEELNNKKIVYDFLGLMKYNNIENLNCSIEKAISLQNEHVGFLSAKNDFINFRDISGNNKRYYIYKVLKNFDTTGKFYIMPNNIDPFSTEMKTINIAEGVFDILGLYYHIFKKYEDNMIYTAINGAGYLNVIKYIMNQGVICDVNVNIFSDSDRPPKYYYNMIERIEPFVNSVNLYYNSLSKDYGVTEKEIKLYEVRV